MKFTAGLICCLLLAASLTAAGSLGYSDTAYAQAQNSDQRQGFNPLRPLFRLFGFDGGKRNRPPAEEPKATRKQEVKREPAKPVIVEQPKDEDARQVLVVGDALAEGLAEGLVAAYAETPSIRIEKFIEARNGLVDQPDPDYPTRVSQILQGQQIAVVVVFLGAGDTRDLTEGENALEFHSPQWEEAYRQRVEKLAKAVRFYKKPLIWIGLPPTKATALRSGFSYLNEQFKSRVEASDAIFVDIWDVFLNEEGKYTSYGPDVEGKRRQLRSNDGVGFTWPGFRKVAFFAEREIARIIGSSGAFAFDGVEDDPNFIVLTGRTTSPEDELAGGEGGLPAPVVDTMQHRLIVRGEALPYVLGRVDDYRLPPP